MYPVYRALAKVPTSDDFPQWAPIGWFAPRVDLTDLLQEHYGNHPQRPLAREIMRTVRGSLRIRRVQFAPDDWAWLARVVTPPTGIRQDARRPNNAQRILLGMLWADSGDRCTHRLPGDGGNGCVCEVPVAGHTAHRCNHGNRWVCS